MRTLRAVILTKWRGSDLWRTQNRRDDDLLITVCEETIFQFDHAGTIFCLNMKVIRFYSFFIAKIVLIDVMADFVIKLF